MSDDRKAKAKHTVHLELRQDFFKPSTLGNCIRLRETQQVKDSVTGKADYEILSSGGVPEGGVEVCKSHVWSNIIRIGPLDAYAGDDCQAVTFRSTVVGVPSSGYQEKLKSEGIVDVHTKNCERVDYSNDADSEEDNSDDNKVRNRPYGRTARQWQLRQGGRSSIRLIILGHASSDCCGANSLMQPLLASSCELLTRCPGCPGCQLSRLPTYDQVYFV